MSRIQIGIALSANSVKYLEFLLWTLERTVSDRARVALLLGVNHLCDERALQTVLRSCGLAWDAIDARPSTQYGSANHGAALDILFARMDSKIGMLMDVDVALLRPKWDVMLEDCLSERCVIVGTEYDGEKYRGFPNVICAMFDRPALRAAGVSFVPEGGYLTVTRENAWIYGRQPGDRILLDTGSELPAKLKTLGYAGRTLTLHRAGAGEAKFMRAGMRGEEYQLEGEPILTHLGRSYAREFGSDEHAIAWERAVRQWLDDAQ